MKLEEIRSIAKSHNINPGILPKTILIKSIQVSEDNFDCFATAYEGECDQAGCCWRDDCLDAATHGWKRS